MRTGTVRPVVVVSDTGKSTFSSLTWAWTRTCPMRAFAADVDRPVAEASTDLGPDRGISGLPRIITGLTAWRISGTSWRIK